MACTYGTNAADSAAKSLNLFFVLPIAPKCSATLLVWLSSGSKRFKKGGEKFKTWGARFKQVHNRFREVHFGSKKFTQVQNGSKPELRPGG